MLCVDLNPRAQSTLPKNREKRRAITSKGQFHNFTQGDYVLVPWSDLRAGEKLCPRWRYPRQLRKALNDFVYQVEDLCNKQLIDVNSS